MDFQNDAEATEIVVRDDSVGHETIVAAQAQKIRKLLRTSLGKDVYESWFERLEFDRVAGTTLYASVPVKFLKNWIQSHYAEALLECCQAAVPRIERVDVLLRTPTPVQDTQPAPQVQMVRSGAAAFDRSGDRASTPSGLRPMPTPATVRTHVNGFEGSPLDPKYTFETYIVGPANRMAHAAATQVAETVFAEERGFNPLFLHSAVGLGKSHLLHAIAWDVKRRQPSAQVLYLTAERFRFTFVEALKAQDAMAFKDKFRSIDILLIDDLEYMQGDKTEQEFEHIINALLDGGKQVVVASARPPAQIERLNDRMRSRLSRGLVTEISALDHDLRLKILERRMVEKRAADPLFEIARPVLELLAERLTENGRELEGAVNRLFAHWQLVRTPISVETAETIIRDLLQGIEPRRVKIDDILRIVSRHFAVSKSDILSQRRHRSVVWPRQIGMYLAKQLTSRSLPEIGRRFGDRDHTTVLHAIRKIDKELEANTRLRDELEELKKQLNR
jgi:chromosomal replication initiator protein